MPVRKKTARKKPAVKRKKATPAATAKKKITVLKREVAKDRKKISSLTRKLKVKAKKLSKIRRTSKTVRRKKK